MATPEPMANLLTTSAKATTRLGQLYRFGNGRCEHTTQCHPSHLEEHTHDREVSTGEDEQDGGSKGDGCGTRTEDSVSSDGNTAWNATWDDAMYLLLPG